MFQESCLELTVPPSTVLQEEAQKREEEEMIEELKENVARKLAKVEDGL